MIAAAAPGDTVWVAPGEYGPFGRALRLPGGIRLIAETGPSSTVISAEGAAVLRVDSPDSAVVVEGLTLDGAGSAEGGLDVVAAQVTVRGCVVRGCWSGIRIIRGGLFAQATTVRECANGIYLYESGGTVTDCEIEDCTQGVTLVSAGPRLRRTTIRNNVTGIVVSEFSSPVIGGNAERANHVSGNRGAAVRNAARARRTGLRALEPLALDLTYNDWGTDCPDSLLFLGPVTFAPWIDASGRSRSRCDDAP